MMSAHVPALALLQLSRPICGSDCGRRIMHELIDFSDNILKQNFKQFERSLDGQLRTPTFADLRILNR